MAKKKSAKVAKKPPPSGRRKAVLLSGGNPQIAKGTATPRTGLHRGHAGWKRDVGRHLDALIVRTVPACTRPSNGNALLWRDRAAGSSPFTVLRSTSKCVLPAHRCALSRPGESKHKEVRYLDIREDEQLDEAQLAAWVKQASQLPGEKM